MRLDWHFCGEKIQNTHMILNKQRIYGLFGFLILSLVCQGQIPYRLSDRPVVLNTSGGQIQGKLLVPGSGDKYPVVLLIAGSGPTDMDGNSAAAGLKNNALKYLAEGLAAKGIATLRYDKRGIASSASAGKEEYSLRFDDYVNDAKGWITHLSRDRRFPAIYVLGHSEGALTGMLASLDNPKVKGYISVAGAGRPFYEVLEEQMAAQPAVIRQMVVSIHDSLKVGKLVPNVPLGLQALFRSSVQPYLISLYQYKPAEIIGKLKMPVLILQGTTDIQISVKDAERLKAAAPEAGFYLIDNMNHVLKTCTTLDRQRQMAVYTDSSLPVDSSLLIFIEKFVKMP